MRPTNETIDGNLTDLDLTHKLVEHAIAVKVVTEVVLESKAFCFMFSLRNSSSFNCLPLLLQLFSRNLILT